MRRSTAYRVGTRVIINNLEGLWRDRRIRDFIGVEGCIVKRRKGGDLYDVRFDWGHTETFRKVNIDFSSTETEEEPDFLEKYGNRPDGLNPYDPYPQHRK